MDPTTSSPIPGSPLDHPAAVYRHLADVLPAHRRERHTACAVLCDAGAYPRYHSTVDTDPAPAAATCARVVGVFADALVGEDPDGALLLAITRPGEARPIPADEPWFHAFNRVCAQRDVRPLGLYVVTPDAMFALTPADML